MAKIIRVAAVVVIFSSFFANADGHLHYRVSASGGSDTNISRAETSANIAEDRFYEIDGSVIRSTSLTNTSDISFSLIGSATRHNEIDGLDHLDAGLGMEYGFKLSDSIRANRYSISITAKGQDYEVDQRDGSRVLTTLSMSRRINQASSFSLGYRFNYRDTDGTVFDTYDEQAFFNYNFIFENQLLLTAGYTFVDGDFISTSQPGSVKIINGSDALEIDNAFGGWAFSQVAYRIDGEADIIDLVLNYPLSDTLFIEASGQHIDVDAVEDNEYDRNIAKFTVIKEF